MDDVLADVKIGDPTAQVDNDVEMADVPPRAVHKQEKQKKDRKEKKLKKDGKEGKEQEKRRAHDATKAEANRDANGQKHSSVTGDAKADANGHKKRRHNEMDGDVNGTTTKKSKR